MTENAIVVTVSPSREADGRQACSSRGPLWDVKFLGRTLATRTPQPLLDGARALLAGGIDEYSRLVMRHEGQNHDALRSTVRVAAGLTVKDNRVGKPVFAPHQPYPASALGKPPVRQSELAATEAA
jgi:hypothetical protein